MRDEGQLDKARREQYNRKVAEDFPEKFIILTSDGVAGTKFNKRMSLRYGQNPGGPAAFYAEERASGPNMGNFEVLQQGKGLGYINLGDMDLGQRIVKRLYDNNPGKIVYCIVKHEMPSAVALGWGSFGAFGKVWGSDPLSSFGGVHVLSGVVTKDLAELLIEKERNVEVVYAPSFSPDALETLAKRESLRVVMMGDINLPSADNGIEYKRVEGGMLVEARGKIKTLTLDDFEVVSKKQPTSYETAAALFNWTVAAYTRSNAVVIGSDIATHGIGSGQRSRIDSAINAINYANGANGRTHFYGSKDTFMASDAFMPATDVVTAAADAGVLGIIYPLGSIKDKEVIDVADERGLVMLATRKPGTQDCERVFLHR